MKEEKSHINALELKAAKLANNGLHLKGEGYDISSYPHGKHGSPAILNGNGWYQKPGVD